MTSNTQQTLIDQQIKFSDVKEEIMACQGVIDDLRILTWRLDDRRTDIDPEDLANIVQGLESLYDLKYQKLWTAIQELETILK